MALRDEKGRFISVKDKEAEIQQNEQVIRQFERILELGGTLSKKQQEQLDTARKANQEYKDRVSLLQETSSLETKINRLTASGIKKKRDLGAEAKKVLSSLKSQQSTIEKQGGDYKEQQDVVNSIVSGQVDLEGILLKQKDLTGKTTKEMEDFLNATKNNLRQKEKEKGVTGALDKLTGGMASNAVDAYKQFKLLGMKTTMMTAGLGAAVAVLVAFNGKLDLIGQNFGAVLDYGNEFQTSLLASEQEATRLGKSLEDVISSTKVLSEEFGFGQTEAAKLSASVIDTSVAVGLSVDEGSKFTGVLTSIGGLSAQTAQDLQKQVFLLSRQNDVAPQAVLRDIANSSEVIAEFTDGTAENIARAAIQSRKFGIDLNNVATSAKGLLDFQSAIENSLTGSMMIGKNINIQRLQQLSLEGDLEKVQLEQRRLLKEMNFLELKTQLHREAAAKALNLSVTDATKLVTKTEEAVTLAGELAGQPGFDALVGSEGISTLTKMSGAFKSMGALLTNSLGPALNLILIALNGIIGVVDFLLEASGINTLLRVLGGQEATYDPGAAAGRFATGVGMTSMADGGIVKMAEGGIVANVGEAGPEAVIPLDEFYRKLDEVVGAINNLNISTTITNQDLNIMLTAKKG